MATIYDNLGAPAPNDLLEGYFALHRFHRIGGGPGLVTPINIYGVDNISADVPTPKVSKDVYQQGGNQEFLPVRRLYNYNGTINMLAGKVMDFLAQAQGISNSLSEYVGLSLIPSIYPVGAIESVARADDGVTQIMNRVYQDVILQPLNMGSPMESELVAVKFMSQHYPVTLITGVQCFYEEFAGDGSTTDFVLTYEPLPIAQATLSGNEDFPLETAFFVKLQLSTDVQGKRQLDVTITPATKTVAFTTAPAASSTVSVLYVAAVPA